MLNVLTHEFRPVSLPFYRLVKLIQFLLRIQLPTIELPIPTLHFVSQPFHLNDFFCRYHSHFNLYRTSDCCWVFSLGGWLRHLPQTIMVGSLQEGFTDTGLKQLVLWVGFSRHDLLCLVFLFPIALCSDTGETLGPSVCRSVRKHPGPVTKGGMFHSVNNLTQQYGNCLRNFCSMNQAILIDYLDGRASDHRQGDCTCNSRHCNTPE